MDVTTILAELPHPITAGPPLARGVKYQHQFIVDLISDGKRLWHAASAEGQAIVSAIKREISDELDAADAKLAAARAEELAKLQAPQELKQSARTPMTIDELKQFRASIDAEIARASAASPTPPTPSNPDHASGILPRDPDMMPKEDVGDDAEAAAKPQ